MARLNSLTERGKETQRLLGEILLKLITEKGYDKITVKDITDKANIDRTTFYLHFKDKDDLFLKSQQQIIDELIEYGQKIDQPYPRATLVFEHMAQQCPACYAMSGARDAIAQAGILENTSVSVLAPGGSAGSILKIQVSGSVPNFMAPLTSLFPGLPGQTFTVRADSTFRQEGW